MPMITDWLMVGITFVYVIATIFICNANIKAAKASRDQIAESKRQFDENRRLDAMPYLQFESTKQSNHNYTLDLILSEEDYNAGEYVLDLRMKNIGRGTAKDIEYSWTNFTKSYPQKSFLIKALQAGDAQYLQITFALPKALVGVTTASFDLHFSDLLENKYSQRVEFVFETRNSSVRLKGHTTQPIIPA